jgi:hypothetical protein
VALAAALLREGMATTRVSEQTQVPFALVEFLAEHPEQPQRHQCPDIAGSYVDPARPWATMAIPTTHQHTALAWPQVRLRLAVSLNLAVAAFSHVNHHPVLTLVCLLGTLPTILIALCHPPARPPNRHSTGGST